MIELGDNVIILKSGIEGCVVDVRDDKLECTVEDNKRDERGVFKLYDCSYSEIKKIQD